MNLKTYNASNEQDRKEAECFGVNISTKSNLFIFEDDDSNDIDYATEFTMKANGQQPCIYTAMKHGLMVEVETLDGKKTIWDFSGYLGYVGSVLTEKAEGKIKSIKLLDMEGEQ